MIPSKSSISELFATLRLRIKKPSNQKFVAAALNFGLFASILAGLRATKGRDWRRTDVTKKSCRARVRNDHTESASKGIPLAVLHRISVGARIRRFRAIRAAGIDGWKIISIPSGTKIRELFAHFCDVIEKISRNLQGPDSRVFALSARVH